MREIHGRPSLQLGGKLYDGAIRLTEFRQRLERLKAVDDLLHETVPFHGVPDMEFARRGPLACYDIRYKRKQTLFPDSGNGKPIFAEGFGIPEAALEAIQSRLDATKERHGVKALYACDSDSRGWNLASRNSDFDVRFIYVHDRDWYLSAASEEKPDTLDLGLEDTSVGEADINGWELHKALKLFRKSNAPLLEWLSSPLVYREKELTIQRLREMIPACFSPLAVWHHYRGLMEKSRARYLAVNPPIKTWFYTDSKSKSTGRSKTGTIRFTVAGNVCGKAATGKIRTLYTHYRPATGGVGCGVSRGAGLMVGRRSPANTNYVPVNSHLYKSPWRPWSL